MTSTTILCSFLRPFVPDVAFIQFFPLTPFTLLDPWTFFLFVLNSWSFQKTTNTVYLHSVTKECVGERAPAHRPHPPSLWGRSTMSHRADVGKWLITEMSTFSADSDALQWHLTHCDRWLSYHESCRRGLCTECGISWLLTSTILGIFLPPMISNIAKHPARRAPRPNETFSTQNRGMQKNHEPVIWKEQYVNCT